MIRLYGTADLLSVALIRQCVLVLGAVVLDVVVVVELSAAFLTTEAKPSDVYSSPPWDLDFDVV